MKKKHTVGPVESRLKRAKRWLNSPDRLVKNWRHIAENARGQSTEASDPQTCRTCAIGAVQRFGFDDVEEEAECVLNSVGEGFDFFKPHVLAEVHALYDRAIARSRDNRL